MKCSGLRKILIFVFYTVDSILHSGLIVGWRFDNKASITFYKFLALRLRFTDKKVTFVMSSVIPANRVQPLVMLRGHEIFIKITLASHSH